MRTQTNLSVPKSKPFFRKNCKYCQKGNESFSNYFRLHRNDWEKIEKFFDRNRLKKDSIKVWKHFKARFIQEKNLLRVKHTAFYVIVMIRDFAPILKIDSRLINLLNFRSRSILQSRDFSRSWFCFRNVVDIPNRAPDFSRYNDEWQRRDSSSCYLSFNAKELWLFFSNPTVAISSKSETIFCSIYLNQDHVQDIYLDFRNIAPKPKIYASTDTSSWYNCCQLQFQNTSILTFSQFTRAQGGISFYDSFIHLVI